MIRFPGLDGGILWHQTGVIFCLHAMRVISGLLLLLTVSVVGQPPPGAGDLPEGVRITPLARSFQPGEVMLVTLIAPRRVDRVALRVFRQNLTLEPGLGEVPTNWWALVGIDLNTKPGGYRLRFDLYEQDRIFARADHRITVKHKKFPTRRLNLPEKFVTPPKASLARIKRESRLVSGIFAEMGSERHWSGFFLRPVPGRANSSFGKRSILNGKPRRPHSGTDFRASRGTPIKSPNAGVTVLAQNLYYAGNTVILDHGQGLYSYFAHLDDFAVKKGDRVERGDLIGHVGSTGRVTGPHLHWTVRLRKALVDPLSLMEILARFESS